MELTKQEKKAYNKLNDLLLLFRVKFRKEQKLTVSDLWWIEAILNLINKLVKENEKMKNKIREIEDKLISFEFETTNYKDLDFISKIIQDLKLITKED